MADPSNITDDAVMEDEYDEEADSDFHEDALAAEDSSPSSDEADNAQNNDQRPRKKRKISPADPQLVQELDSGDEATIKEQKKTRRRQKKQGADEIGNSGDESEGWRARTRAMREQEKDERKRNKLATSKGSTIDVNKIWEDMNRPESHAPPRLVEESLDETTSVMLEPPNSLDQDADKENRATPKFADMITIKRTYNFAGEIHTEEKTVPRSSAEAQLWLAQQQSSKVEAISADGQAVQRPLRKFSRFDPNLSNIDSFKAAWTGKNAPSANFRGPKLNVVEKSKMDWAVHVDSEGLKDELDTHAKAKEGYLNRMDFLRDVEQRKEDEARAARLRGR